LFSVTLFRRGPESDAQKSAIGRYGDKAERNIIARGGKCEKIYFTFNRDAGILKGIRKGFIDPLMQLINNNGKSDIYHAVDELSGIFLPFARGKKVVTFHHVSSSDEDISGFIGYLIWRISAAITLRYADIILAVSPQTRDEMVRHYKMDPKDIRVLTQEIGGQFKRLEGTERSKSVGYVGSLIQRKNVQALIRAFGKVVRMPDMSDAKLIICGKGSEYNDLVRLTEELNITGNVEFVSNLTDKGIVELYNTVSVSVLPSNHEGMGLPIIEAQRCHTPVLYFRDARIPDEVKKYAVPCSDEDDLSEKIYRCLSDRTYRDGIADAAYEYAHEIGESFGEELFGIYEDLLK